MNIVYERVLNAVTSVRQICDFVPKVGLVLGSGLGDYADHIQVVKEIPFSEISEFPVSTAPGHDGKLIFGYDGEVPVALLKGRVHYYEGYSMEEVVLPTRLLKMLGCEILFLTNASGGINKDYQVGDLMMLTDHISSFVPNPLVGRNIDELGVRFPDMTKVYDRELQQILRETAEENGIALREGIYVQTMGPSYESPAEINMFRMMGADAVGMSTVVEAIAANHMGMRVCAVSCISNKAAGLNEQPLTHEEIKIAGDLAVPKFQKLITQSIRKMV